MRVASLTHTGHEVHHDVVVTDAPIRIAIDTFEDVGNIANFNIQAGLLLHFAPGGNAQILAQFDHPTGKGPVASQWFTQALHQQNLVPAQGNDAYTETGIVGIFTSTHD